MRWTMVVLLMVSVAGQVRAQDGATAQTVEADEPPPATVLLPGQAAPASDVPAPGAGSSVADGPSSTELRIAALKKERDALRLRRPRILIPVLMTLVGVTGAAVAGNRLADTTCIDDHGHRTTCAWTGTMKLEAAIIGLGSALAASGLVFLTVRIVQRRRHKEALKRIDDELQLLTSAATVAPWLSRTQTGLALGASAALKF